ncbi:MULTISPECIES: ABC transporter ATP-binding protein [Auritidibacter]|uniref:ABC transporter ATP-binding protein n=1 Tax=Auritidibacter ignavus TaxID=678932 RepID=A0AAJ6APZ4_9MICC|nr:MULTISPECIES: ABC transporter ATP-binding protein [Auritidibacter]AXR73515.1 ABC transporter ATP-binding protein [Auritidibacter sp. NML130574]NIH70666.1 iron complex transport system ATP-binding protein [Auritidibacter ignavus]PXA81557.1 iron ABC transporter ATP-binding protein [Auritidibacter sp. NML120636]RMX23206.1 ABC transporter ATP-binding protein [Auritidibacter ignavus]WGH82101.1 ABC transporter ATP-binding protein [Auritidibacter ignavus]
MASSDTVDTPATSLPSPHEFDPQPDAVLEFADATVVRGQQTILDAVSFSVTEGQRWIVMGPNGAGKSTLINLAATRMHPTRGNVAILGETLGAVNVFELRPLVGVSSVQVARQIPATEKILDTVVTASWGVTGRWTEEYDQLDLDRARWLLRRWGIAHDGDRRIGTLSEGELKRVLIARAMMTDPELLLLDEPAAGLDLAGRETLVRSLAQLAEDPLAPTPVLVTHHVEDIPQGFTHALVLRNGRVVSAGPIETALTEETLSEAFRLPLHVSRTAEGRFTAFARG